VSVSLLLFALFARHDSYGTFTLAAFCVCTKEFVGNVEIMVINNSQLVLFSVYIVVIVIK